MTSQTKKEQQLVNLIGKHTAIIAGYQSAIYSHVKRMLCLVDSLRTHTKNRIAAYKTPTTMAKKASKWEEPIPYVLSKKKTSKGAAHGNR